MAATEQLVPPLVEGQRLDRDEFLRRWEAMPRLKRAELIKGIVRMPSPTSMDHGDSHSDVNAWLANYAAQTPGTKANDTSTSLMLEDAPQPDCHLRILPEAGGIAKRAGKYLEGGLELVAEVSLSSAHYDLHEKFELYDQAGVLEYVVVLLEEQELRWFARDDAGLRLVPEPADGIWRSRVFPGPAFLAGDLAQVLATLQQGLETPEHAAFAAELASRLKS
jgi:Uma2 family endonuclease